MDSIKQTVSDTADYISGKTGQAEHATKQKGHEEGAKDSSAPLTDRISDGANYLKEGANKKGEQAKAESNKPFGN